MDDQEASNQQHKSPCELQSLELEKNCFFHLQAQVHKIKLPKRDVELSACILLLMQICVVTMLLLINKT